MATDFEVSVCPEVLIWVRGQLAVSLDEVSRFLILVKRGCQT